MNICFAIGLALISLGEIPATEQDWNISQGWLTFPHALDTGKGNSLTVYVEPLGTLPDGVTICSVDVPEPGVVRGTYRFEEIEIVDQYEPIPELGKHALRRSVRVRNVGKRTLFLNGIVLWFSPILNEASSRWSPRYPFRMIAFSPPRLLCLAGWSEKEDHYFVDDPEKGIGLAISCAWRLEPGEESQTGAAEVWIGDSSSPDAFRREARRWYGVHGFQDPLVYPDWLQHGILYEASAGGHIDSRFSDVGGFRAFSHQMDYLTDLGVNVLWLNAVHEHKTPPDPVNGGWNLYDPLDFEKIDPILGGEEGLRFLGNTARQCGIHLLGEIVPHGGHSRQAAALEPWWIRHRDMTPVRPWGGFGMDYASPEWQDVMRKAVSLVADIAKIEGLRIDVADGNGFNWGSPRTHQASYSSIGGGLEMLRAVRDGIAQNGVQNPILIPESGENRIEYFTVEDAAVVGYGMEFTDFLRRDLTAGTDDPTVWRERLVAFLEDERGSLPPGALVLRTLNNHDTVCAHNRAVVQFGVGLSRALYGVCVAIPGIPMLYQEDEIGSFEVLRRLNWARRHVPEIATGEVDYTSFLFAPEVFTVTYRINGTCKAIALVNLSPATVSRSVRLPQNLNLAEGTTLYDAVSGGTTSVNQEHLSYTLSPYSTSLLCVEPPIEKPPYSYRFDGETTPPHLQEIEKTAGTSSLETGRFFGGRVLAEFADGQARTEPGASLTFGEGDNIVRVFPAENSFDVEYVFNATIPSIRLYGMDRWVAMGATARLEDRFVRRRFAFPEGSNYVWDKTKAWTNDSVYRGTAPTGRLWQSVLEPLDPETPCLGFVDRQGKGFVLTVLDGGNCNIVLTDCGDEPDKRDNGCLELRFYGDDPDLQPHVREFGPNTPWRISAPLQHTVTPTRVRVRFTRLQKPLADALPEKERYAAPHMQHYHTNVPVNIHNRALLLPVPGELTWGNIATVPGRFRIRFQLRTSEQSSSGRDLCDAYRVSLNGTELPLEWISFESAARFGNAYFGWASTPTMDFDGTPCDIRIHTTKPWCGIFPVFELIPVKG